MANFKEVNFGLKDLIGDLLEDGVVFSFRFMYHKGNTNITTLVSARIVDKLNRVYKTKLEKVFYKHKLFQDIVFEIPIVHNKLLVKGLKLELEFLNESGEKVFVEYTMNGLKEGFLSAIKKINMSNEEKSLFINLVAQMNNGKKIEQHDEIKPRIIKGDAKEGMIVAKDMPGLKKHFDALAEEKKFLKAAGGKKCQVSSGKFLGGTQGNYMYSFELEDELYISDDAPITLLFAQNKYNGYVLICEDFEIVISIGVKIGDKISSAFISVEPWKLLESLEEKLSRQINIQSKVADKLFEVGPTLATNKPIELIEKGQEFAKKHAMTEPVTIVWGPPGTGKTHTMSELTIDFINQDKSVLIVSHSNVSVDGVAKKIYELLCDKKEDNIYKSGQVLRYGYIRDEELNNNPYISSFKFAVKKNPVLNDELDVLQSKFNELKHKNGISSPKMVELHKRIGKIKLLIKDEEYKCVNKAKVVATTISKVVIDKLFDDKRFDVVIFDEVSMAYVLQVACAATYAKEHFICVGDFMQLPPIAQSNAKKILCQDIFSYLGICEGENLHYHPWLVMLNEQRRMHPAISKFANYKVYHKMLDDHPSVEENRKEIVEEQPFAGNPVNLINLFGTYCAAGKNPNNSRYNVLSAFISFATAVEAEKKTKKVSIITPYAAQTRLIRALIQDYRDYSETNIRCATVHQFQGSESNVILFDAVESYPGSKVGFLMGKDLNSVKRLINVAVTRAKGKLITVCNGKFWESGFKGSSHLLYKLQQYSVEEGNQISYKDNILESFIDDFRIEKTMKFFTNNSFMELYKEDLKKAQNKIVISLPSCKLDQEHSCEIISVLVEMKRKGVEVLVKSNEYEGLSEEWKNISYSTTNAIFPITMIDDKITWYGAPKANWSFVVNPTMKLGTVSYITCRVKGKRIAEMIKSFSDLEYREVDGLVKKLNEKHTTNNKEYSLSDFVKETRKCQCCKRPLKLTRGKMGKIILWCDKCRKTELLTVGEIDTYIQKYNVDCPMPNCAGKLRGALGNDGVYVKCSEGHKIKPEIL